MRTGCYRCRGYNVADCIVRTGCYRCRGYSVVDCIVCTVFYRCRGYSVADSKAATGLIVLGNRVQRNVEFVQSVIGVGDIA